MLWGIIESPFKGRLSEQRYDKLRGLNSAGCPRPGESRPCDLNATWASSAWSVSLLKPFRATGIEFFPPSSAKEADEWIHE